MSCKDNIDLRPAFINSFNNLYNYASLTKNVNSNLYKPSSDTYGDVILNYNVLFSNTISPNIDFENYSGNEDIIENKDNFFIIDNDNKEIYENCAITTSIPWYSTNDKFNNCEISTNIQLDDNNILKFSDDKKTINYNFKSKNKNAPFCSHYKNTNKAYCENSWYDWLIIPNFYLGNTYYKDIGKYTEKDVYKCYKPCDGDYIPFTNSKKEMQCIPKKFYLGGLLENKYKFSALGLINLIGNITTNTNDNNKKNINLTYINYLLIFYYNHIKNIDRSIYTTNDQYLKIINTINDDGIFNSFKSNIRTIEDKFNEAIKKEILGLNNFNDFDNSPKQDYNTLKIFSYKSTEFQEKTNDLYTLNGLESNNVLIDPILIHTWILANLYRPYEASDLTNVNIDVKEVISTNSELYDLLYAKNFTNNDKNNNISIRLKNIFFRAVNVCYNNKTTFSANIINKTKKALQNKELINFIYDNNLYTPNLSGTYVPSASTTNKGNIKRNNIFNSADSLKSFLEDLNNLDIFTEIEYYDDINLKDLIYRIQPNNDYIKNITGDKDKNSDNRRFKYLFSIEYLEVSNNCKLNEDYNPVTGLCTLKAPKFEEIKKDIVATDIDSINDQFKLPQMKYFITLFIQVIFVIILGYIFYLFYNIFGETLLASINWIYETFIELINDARIMNYKTKIDTTESMVGNTNITNMNNISKIKLDHAKSSYDNINRKIKEMELYIKSHNLEEDEEDNEEDNDEDKEKKNEEENEEENEEDKENEEQGDEGEQEVEEDKNDENKTIKTETIKTETIITPASAVKAATKETETNAPETTETPAAAQEAAQEAAIAKKQEAIKEASAAIITEEPPPREAAQSSFEVIPDGGIHTPITQQRHTSPLAQSPLLLPPSH
jgi:hypothetical protein